MRHAVQNGLTLVAEIRAEKRKQLDHNFVGDFPGNLRACTTSTTRIADLGEECGVALDELAFFLDLFGGPRCPRRGCGLALGLQAAVRHGARGHESVAQAKAERMPGRCVRDDQSAQPIPQ